MQGRGVTMKASKIPGLEAVVLMAFVAGCGKGEQHRPEPLPVRVQVVQTAGGADGVRYSAQVLPDVEIDLAFKVSGYIDELLQVRGADERMRNVQEGDRVRRGQVLAHVRDNEHRDRVAEALAALTQARSEYDRTVQMYEN